MALCRDGQTTTYHNMETGWEASFVHSTRHYIEALTKGTTPSLTAAQGRKVLQFALAAEQSARDGAAIQIR